MYDETLMVYVQVPIKPKETLKAEYLEQTSSFERVLYELHRRLTTIFHEHHLRATIKHRVKNFRSYYQKIQMRSKEIGGSGQLFISDVLGIRVVCPFLDDLAAVEQLISESFNVQEREKKGAEFSVKEFGYDALHFLISLPPYLIESFHLSDALVVEIQLRTILQDAWAEVEHEIVYKSQITHLDVSLRRKLAALNANLSLSDMIFYEIRTYQRELQHQLDQNQNALAQSTNRLEINPHNTDALLSRAQLYYSLGNYAEAIKDCDCILVHRPDHEHTRRFREFLKAQVEG